MPGQETGHTANYPPYFGFGNEIHFIKSTSCVFWPFQGQREEYKKGLEKHDCSPTKEEELKRENTKKKMHTRSTQITDS